jgi:HAD superfamily hydrolase (TIGR01509 family)
MPVPALEAVIFDVDGTLIDSVDVHARAWVEALESFGYEVPLAKVRRQIGKGGDHLLPALLPPDVVEARGKEMEAYRSKLFKEIYLPNLVAFPCVRELVQRVVADGILVALGSSAKADELGAYKRIANIGDLLDAETSSGDAAESKPDPDIFQAALHRLGKKPPHVIVVGDTPYDAEAAAKAGLRSIGLLCGGWSEDDLRQAGCLEIYRDPEDLLARYAQSALAAGSAGGPRVDGPMRVAKNHARSSSRGR